MERVPGGDMEKAKPAVNSFYQRLLERVSALPGVESVGSGGIPTHFSGQSTFSIMGRPTPPAEQRPQAGDIGIRRALGAHPADILKWVGKLGFQLISIGIVAGVALALGLTRLISAILFGVKPSDPLTYLAVALGLAAVACLACYIPARRAAKVDPMVALRYE